MKAGLALGAMLVLLGGCGDYPRDVAHTSDRVKASGVIRVGLVAGGDADTARAYIARVERATGARARATTGASEHLLARLEDGQLDLVLGPFAKDSPWADDVALLDPIDGKRIGQRTLGLTPVARNGENRWIMTLEHEARALGTAR